MQTKVPKKDCSSWSTQSLSLSHGMCLYQVMMMLHFLNDSLMTNQHKNQNYVIIASLKSKTMGKLINRIPGSRLLTSKPGDVNKHSQSLAW